MDGSMDAAVRILKPTGAISRSSLVVLNVADRMGSHADGFQNGLLDPLMERIFSTTSFCLPWMVRALSKRLRKACAAAVGVCSSRLVRMPCERGAQAKWD